MKTRMILMLAASGMVFFAATALLANRIGIELTRQTPVVRHEVVIHMPFEKELCNLYLVVVYDQNKMQVAPAQMFVPDKDIYVFYEPKGGPGIRTAALIVAPYGHHFECEQELFTEPCVIMGNFYPGTSYFYELFPALQGGHN